ncbi:MAG TPA: tRNA dihydrouridine synthase DusB [Nitrospirota bacterium]|nr:tRNA dihydrouridine synthase DusB [Nitrospirota bacterium]
MLLNRILGNNPLVLAPMAGITDLPFRLICKEMGAGLVFSEMVSVEALIREHRRTHGMLRTDPAERPVVFQIFGSRPASMAEAAHIVSQGEVDFIDINMGCPVPKVLKSGAGSALLRDLELAKEIMSAVVKASNVPVTVKIRLGWDSKNIVAVDLARAAEDAGVAAVTIHGRTKAQGFSGTADWNMIRSVKESVSIPVIGNGDVRSAGDVRRMLDETGCDGVMIGRAIQGNPWIFRDAKRYLETGVVPAHPSYDERQAVMLRHLNDMIRLVGENSGVREMRKHLCWYTKGLPGGSEFRQRINLLERMTDVRNAISSYFHALSTTSNLLCHSRESGNPF